MKLKKETEELHEFVDKEINASKKQAEQLKQMIEAGEPEPPWHKEFKQYMKEYRILETRKVQSEGYKDLKDFFKAIGAHKRKRGNETKNWLIFLSIQAN